MTSAATPELQRLTPSAIVGMYKPSVCELRSYYRLHGVEEEAEPSAFAELLRRLGERHEHDHLQTLGPFVDCGEGDEEARLRRTTEACANGVPVVYQGLLRTRHILNGVACEIVGAPDFLLRAPGGYVVRDAKLARRIDKSHHPEILLQVGLYGWLFERTFGRGPLRCEVFAGAGDVVEVAYDGGADALRVLAILVALARTADEPYEPVGWSKCDRCGYRNRCWARAEAGADSALLMGVDQKLARTLRSAGVLDYHELLARFDVERLSRFEKLTKRGRLKKVGSYANVILRSARAISTNQAEVFAPLRVPAARNYVMFDLEGLPPTQNELDKIYLWGLHVYGDDPGEFMPAVADFGSGGDRAGWELFLEAAGSIFDRHGEIPFVHWSSYEKTNVKMYMERYGDPRSIAARVLTNSLDLLAAVRCSIALPLPSLALKQVEKYFGYQRKQREFGGDWAMAKFIEATETTDEAQRSAIMQEILDYNREDLAAMWHVFVELRKLAGPARRKC